MPLVCSFTVLGDAKPQGSTRTRTFRDAHGQLRTAITHSNRDSLMQWRQDIRSAVQVHVPQLANELLRGPVAVRVMFELTRPPSISKKRLYPIVAPDLDKLQRAVGDALEHTVLHCDSQIVHWEATKVYTPGRAQATIEIWQPDALASVGSVNPFQQQGLF